MNLTLSCATTLGFILIAAPAFAQSPNDPSVVACKATGLLALQAQAADITALEFDMDTRAISAADTKIEDIPVKTVLLGEAYITRKEKTASPDRFVCLLGEKGKVLLTFLQPDRA